MAVVTPTDRPKSVCNCCLIELFCGVCVVTIHLRRSLYLNLPFWHFVFCHRTESHLFLFVFTAILLNGYRTVPRPNEKRSPSNICDRCGLPAGHAYSSGHLSPPLIGTCICSNCWPVFLNLGYFPDFSLRIYFDTLLMWRLTDSRYRIV